MFGLTLLGGGDGQSMAAFFSSVRYDSSARRGFHPRAETVLAKTLFVACFTDSHILSFQYYYLTREYKQVIQDIIIL